MEKKSFLRTGIASVSLLSTMALTSVLAHHGQVHAAEASATNQTDAQKVATQQQLLDNKTAELAEAQASLQADTEALANTNQLLTDVADQLAQAAAPITTTDLASIASGVSGEYLTPDKQAILDKLNAIRKEAYDLGYVSSYVPLKWSTDLEKMAMTRAAEATVTLGHTRLDGSRYNSMVSENGVSHHGENLAWGTYMNASAAIDYWYSEKAGYAAGDRSYQTVGHYIQIIDPSHTHTALGIFATDNPTAYNNITVAEAFATDNKGAGESLLGTYGRTDQGAVSNTADTQALQAKQQDLEAQKAALQARIATKQQSVDTLTQAVADARAALEAAQAAVAPTEDAAQPQPAETSTDQPAQPEPSLPDEGTEVSQDEATDTIDTSSEDITDDASMDEVTESETIASVTPLEEDSPESDVQLEAIALVDTEEATDVTTDELEDKLAALASTTDADTMTTTQATPGETTPEVAEQPSIASNQEESSAEADDATSRNEIQAVASTDEQPEQSEQPEASQTTEADNSTTTKSDVQESDTTPQTALEKAEAQGALLPNTGVSPENYVAFGTAASAILTGLGLTIPRPKKKHSFTHHING